MIALPDVVFFSSIPLLAVYFYLFRSTFRTLPPAEQKRFISDAGIPTWRRLVGLAPIPLMLVIPNTPIRLLLASWFLIQLAIDSRLQAGKLESLGFSNAFRTRFRRVDALAFVVVLTFCLGLILRGRAT